ncbi:MAG: rhodanese-like domain-containing protein [Cytophagales bacterium]|nr:MAG: rhodanese-like domain-containing protein [Cytophagales bacterium]
MDITAKELIERMDKKEKLNILDVRETWEYEEQNIGATLIPLGEIADRVAEIEAWKEEEVIVHCRSGKRSATAQKFLESQGFSNVRNLIGGILQYNEDKQ